MTKKLDDKTAHDILIDSVDFKLVLAKHYLEKIQQHLPLNYDWKHFVLESHSESFLFFSNLAIESLAFKINEKYNLLPEAKYVTKRIVEVPKSNLWQVNDFWEGGKFYDDLTIYNVRDSLNKSDKDQNQIRNLINQYFEYPKSTKNGWDLSRSWLWVMREMRNHIAHSMTINRMAIKGSVENTLFLFRLTISPYREKTKKRNDIIGEKIAITFENPHHFFSFLFDNLVKFVDDIRTIISYKAMSSQYKNQLDFELYS